MKTVQEEDLIFDVSSALRVEKFDDKKLHGNRSSMKKVDFIIEESERIVFLEVKDPDIPEASNVDEFKESLKNGNLIYELAGKYRDSFLFALQRAELTKPVHYIVLISMDSLDKALLVNMIDGLNRSIPISHRSWTNNLAASTVILKLDSYKQQFGDQSVWRASDFEK
jgi:hypothetical protein